MISNVFRFSAAGFEADEAHLARAVAGLETDFVSPFKLRALATGAALATSVDSSPGVLVGIYDYTQRNRASDRSANLASLGS